MVRSDYADYIDKKYVYHIVPNFSLGGFYFVDIALLPTEIGSPCMDDW